MILVLAGGSSSGKSTLIRDGMMKIKRAILSTDSMGEEIMEVHNNAKYYETHDPQRLAAAEELVHKGIKSRFGKAADRNVRLDFHDPCFSAERISAILFNGAHNLKKLIYTDAIRKYAAEGHRNVILDMICDDMKKEPEPQPQQEEIIDVTHRKSNVYDDSGGNVQYRKGYEEGFEAGC